MYITVNSSNVSRCGKIYLFIYLMYSMVDLTFDTDLIVFHSACWAGRLDTRSEF